MGATILNTVLSLGALGLWFFSPNRGRDGLPSATSTNTSAPFPVAAQPPPGPPNRFPQRRPGQAAPLPAPPDMPAGALPPARFDARGLSRTGNFKIAPSTQALADRLHLDAQILAQTFADEAGELPPHVAKRLEHAFDSSTSLAKTRKLDESQSQSVVAILTYYEFSVLREEKAAAPGPADPSRIESIRNEILTDIRTTCGEDTAKATELEIDRW